MFGVKASGFFFRNDGACVGVLVRGVNCAECENCIAGGVFCFRHAMYGRVWSEIRMATLRRGVVAGVASHSQKDVCVGICGAVGILSCGEVVY